jgi:hypothetical protein
VTRAVDGAVVVEFYRPLDVPDRLHGPVVALLAQCVIEERRRIVWIKAFGDLELLSRGLTPVLLGIRLADVAANQCVAWSKPGGDFDLMAPALQIAAADDGETIAQARQGIGGIGLYRAAEGVTSPVDIERRQGCESQHRLGAAEVGRQGHRPLRRFQGTVAIPQCQLKLRQARPGQGNLRHAFNGLKQLFAGSLKIEGRLVRVGQRDSRDDRTWAEIDGLGRLPEGELRIGVGDGDRG